MTDRPQTSKLEWNGHHEHAWRCVNDEDSSAGELVFHCTTCHPTRPGLRVGSNGTLQSASDVASDQQQASADERERALDRRESKLRAWELRHLQLKNEVEDLLAKAAQRDEVADARDWPAGKRDMTANLDAWLDRVEDRADAGGRQDALDDQLHAQADRRSSALNRATVADDPSSAQVRR
jgi:hypothetical protein